MLAKKIETAFAERFGSGPTLVRSPGRINLIGEHTDYNKGFVLPAAIDKSIFLAAANSDSDTSVAVALDLDESHEFTLKDLQPIASGNWRNYVLGVVSEIKKTGKEIGNFNLVFGGDIPIGTGLSSSAALENGIVFALNEVFDLGLSRLEMVRISQRAEYKFARVRCGIMDQFATMFGEQGKAMFLDCRSLEFEQIEIDLAGFELVLIDTKIEHRLAETGYNERRSTCERIAEKLNVDALRDATVANLDSIRGEISENDFKKASFVLQENKRVCTAVEALRSRRMEAFGEELYRSHEGLKNDYDVSRPELDFLVNGARKSTFVSGARMMGAGFGGCTINLVESRKTDELVARLKQDYEKTFGSKFDVLAVNLSRGTRKIES